MLEILLQAVAESEVDEGMEEEVKVLQVADPAKQVF